MPRLVVDRYEIFEEIASGGMATVFLGRLRGGSGFARTVAIKRLHQHLARDPQFVAMFLDEARLAARIRHPNVVSTLDVVSHEGELLVVMDYVHGESLARVRAHLASQDKKIPLAVVGAIVSGMLQGLHAAHEAKDEVGRPLDIVHRDVSPQNVLLGVDGVARVVDFGVAKAAGRIQTTADGQVKGKASYMAPEQIGGRVDRRTDVFAAAIVLWELLTSRRLFTGESQAETLARVLAADVPSPRTFDPSLPSGVEELVLAALDPVPDRRFATAREMDQALLRAMPVASTFDVAEWLAASLGTLLDDRANAISAIESNAERPHAPSPHEGSTIVTESIPVSVAAPASSRRSLWTGVAIAALFAGGGLLLARSMTAGRGPVPLTVATGAAAEGPAPRDPPATAAIPSPSSATAGGGDPLSLEAGSAPVPSVSTAPSAAPARPPPRVRPRPSKSCDPPYWVDAKGKHFKDECL